MLKMSSAMYDHTIVTGAAVVSTTGGDDANTGENDTAEDDDSALQTDGGITLEKALSDALARFARQTMASGIGAIAV